MSPLIHGAEQHHGSRRYWDLTGTRAPALAPSPHPGTGDAFVPVPSALGGLSGQASVPLRERGLPQHAGALDAVQQPMLLYRAPGNGADVVDADVHGSVILHLLHTGCI